MGLNSGCPLSNFGYLLHSHSGHSVILIASWDLVGGGRWPERKRRRKSVTVMCAILGFGPVPHRTRMRGLSIITFNAPAFVDVGDKSLLHCVVANQEVVTCGDSMCGVLASSNGSLETIMMFILQSKMFRLYFLSC